MACALGLFLVAPVFGATIEIGSPMGTMVIDSSEYGQTTDLGPDHFRWQGNMSNLDMGWAIDWDLTIDLDPFVTGVSAFTNLMAGTANFTYNISANSTEAIAFPTVNGASTISVLDTNGNGATMAALAGSSIYDAHILAVSQQSLFDHPFSLVAAPFGVNQTGTSWGPQAATGPIGIGDLFGIDHEFSLTGNDQATINSSFFIVPEPASGLLVLLAAAGLIRRRR
jgi:hypothetical protein